MENEKKSAFSKTPIRILCAVIATGLWGSAFPSIKTGYRLLSIESSDTASQMLFAGIRFTLAGILTIIIFSLMKGRFLKPKKESAGRIFTLAMFQTVGQYIFFYMSLAHISGVKSSIIGAAGTFITLIISIFIFKMEKATMRKIIACLCGFAGVVLMNLGGSLGGFSIFGDGAMLLANISAAFAAVYIKKFSEKDDPVMLSGYQFMLGGIILSIIAKAMGGHVEGFSIGSSILMVYMGLISAVAYSLWALLLKYNPVSKVVIFGFLVPVFGVFLSAVFLGEWELIGINSLAALIFVSVGIRLISVKPTKKL